MYEDPGVDECAVTVVLRFAADAETEPEMRGELTDRIMQLAEDFGCEAEIHSEDLLARP
jgi:hypothetical protein